MLQTVIKENIKFVDADICITASGTEVSEQDNANTEDRHHSKVIHYIGRTTVMRMSDEVTIDVQKL